MGMAAPGSSCCPQLHAKEDARGNRAITLPTMLGAVEGHGGTGDIHRMAWKGPQSSSGANPLATGRGTSLLIRPAPEHLQAGASTTPCQCLPTLRGCPAGTRTYLCTC